MDFTAAQKKAILASGHNILVSAGAGSGKTTVLTERVIGELLSGREIDRLLILTFTDNAARSMKGKIRRALQKESVGNRFLSEQLSRLETADIMTFDAFNRKLVSRYFYVLGLNPRFEIVNSSLLEARLCQTIRAIFDRHYASRDEVFLRMLEKYTVKDDSRLADLTAALIKSEDNSADPESDLRNKRDNPLSALGYLDMAYESLLSKGKDAIRSFLGSFADCRDDGPYGHIRKAALAQFDGFEKAGSVPELAADYDRFAGLRLRRRNGEADEAFRLAYETGKKRLKAFFGKLKDDYVPKEDAARIIAAQKPYLGLLCGIAYEAYISQQEYKSQHNVYGFHDIALLALRILKDNPDIRNEVASSYDEIMVDEYQDNSDLQEQLLSLIGRDNLFMVGDVKQSIYGFRNAEPKYFADRFSRYSVGDGGELVIMNENFRSSPEVISDINALFAKIMSAGFGGADYAEKHMLVAANRLLDRAPKLHTRILSYVQPGVGSAPNIAAEARIIAHDILSRIAAGEEIGPEHQKAEFRHFAVIADRGTQFEEFAQVFKDYHIPLKIEKDRDALSQQIIMALRSLMILYGSVMKGDFASDRFRHSLLSVVRGPFGRYAEPEIDLLFRGRGFRNDRTVMKMAGLVAKTERKDLLSAYQSLLSEFDVLGCLKDFYDPAASLDFLLSYQSLIKDMSVLGYTMEDAIGYFGQISLNDDLKTKLAVNASRENSVTLTNVHKSKGLEYPIIYFIGLSKKYNLADAKDRFAADPAFGIILPFTGDDFPSVTPSGRSQKVPPNPLRLLAQSRSELKDKQEKVRLLYVDLTRARYQMNFLVREPSSPKYLSAEEDCLSFKDLIDYSGFSAARTDADPKPEAPSALPAAARAETELPQLSYETLSMPEYSPRTTASSAQVHADPDSVRKGLLLHSCLEAVSLAAPDLSFISDPWARKAVEGFLGSRLVSGLKGYEEYHEYRFFDPKRGLEGSMDLLMVGPDEAVVIDYKLRDIADEEYVRQLSIYKENAERLFRKKTSCYLYSLLTQEYRRIC